MKKNQLADSASAAEAIDRVLGAEAEAREAMQGCREEAERMLEAARKDARRILRTSNQRVVRLNETCNRLINEKTEAMRDKARQARSGDDLDGNDQARLGKAVERVAEKLTRIEK